MAAALGAGARDVWFLRSLGLSAANIFFRDVKYLVQVFLTFGIFITPVMLDALHVRSEGSQI